MIKLREWHFPSPYGRNSMGQKDHLEKLTLDLSKADHARRYHAKDAILVARRATSISSELKDEVEQQFGDWNGAAPSRGSKCCRRRATSTTSSRRASRRTSASPIRRAGDRPGLLHGPPGDRGASAAG